MQAWRRGSSPRCLPGLPRPSPPSSAPAAHPTEAVGHFLDDDGKSAPASSKGDLGKTFVGEVIRRLGGTSVAITRTPSRRAVGHHLRVGGPTVGDGHAVALRSSSRRSSVTYASLVLVAGQVATLSVRGARPRPGGATVPQHLLVWLLRLWDRRPRARRGASPSRSALGRCRLRARDGRPQSSLVREDTHLARLLPSVGPVLFRYPPARSCTPPQGSAVRGRGRREGGGAPRRARGTGPPRARPPDRRRPGPRAPSGENAAVIFSNSRRAPGARGSLQPPSLARHHRGGGDDRGLRRAEILVTTRC